MRRREGPWEVVWAFRYDDCDKIVARESVARAPDLSASTVLLICPRVFSVNSLEIRAKSSKRSKIPLSNTKSDEIAPCGYQKCTELRVKHN